MTDSKDKNFIQTNKLVVDFMPAVRAMAYRLKERLPSSVDVQDLISIGMMEMIKLSRRYKIDENDSFWGYAKKRVYGSMLDHLRSLDVISRSSRRLVKAIDVEISKYASEDIFEPSDEFLAKQLGEPIEKIREAKTVSRINTNVPLNEHIMGIQDAEIEKEIEKEQMLDAIKNVMGSLSDREQQIIELYYYEELNLKEISRLLDISESRISQIHKKLVIILRERLIE